MKINLALTKKEFKKLAESFGGFGAQKNATSFKEDFLGKGNVVLTIKRAPRKSGQIFDDEKIEAALNKESAFIIKDIVFGKKQKNKFDKEITISFDHLPFGFLVEFKGNPEVLHQYFEQFNILEKSRITKAYLGSREDYKGVYRFVKGFVKEKLFA